MIERNVVVNAQLERYNEGMLMPKAVLQIEDRDPVVARAFSRNRENCGFCVFDGLCISNGFALFRRRVARSKVYPSGKPEGQRENRHQLNSVKFQCVS